MVPRTPPEDQDQHVPNNGDFHLLLPILGRAACFAMAREASRERNAIQQSLLGRRLHRVGHFDDEVNHRLGHDAAVTARAAARRSRLSRLVLSNGSKGRPRNSAEQFLNPRNPKNLVPRRSAPKSNNHQSRPDIMPQIGRSFHSHGQCNKHWIHIRPQNDPNFRTQVAVSRVTDAATAPVVNYRAVARRCFRRRSSCTQMAHAMLGHVRRECV